MGLFSILFGGSSEKESSGSEKTAKVWFSHEHVGSLSGKLETDGYRSVDGGRTEKISHNECEPVNVPINKS